MRNEGVKMEQTMENEMGTGFIQGLVGVIEKEPKLP